MIAEIYTDNKFMACQGVLTCRIAVSNSGEDLSQLINKLQPSIATREKEHPSQRVYTTFFTDHCYHNQDQAPSAQAPSTQAPSAQAPSAQAPSAQAPSGQAPSAQAPSGQAPSVQAPSAQAPSHSSAETSPLTPTAPRQPAQQARSVNDIPTHQQQGCGRRYGYGYSQYRRGFRGSQGSYRGGYQRDSDRNFS